MSEIAKLISVHVPKVRVGRPDDFEHSSDMCVWVDDFKYVSFHYNYAHTDNATQWKMAEVIAAMLSPTTGKE